MITDINNALRLSTMPLASQVEYWLASKIPFLTLKNVTSFTGSLVCKFHLQFFFVSMMAIIRKRSHVYAINS